MNPSAEDILHQAKVQLEQGGHPQPACSPDALETIQRTWPEEFGYEFPPEYADLVRIVNGGLESGEFQLGYVPDPASEVDQLRRKAHREDLLQLNPRMRDSHGNEMRRKIWALKPIMRWTWRVVRSWNWMQPLSMISPWPHGLVWTSS
jgi:hypothetical protein